jgi:two-component system, cell cycle sensor histidine kinase and response regulator CckA
MEKHHSCLNTRAIIEYFDDRFPAALPRLLTGLGPDIAALPDSREFLMEINNWVSSDVVITMFHNAREITQDENIAFEIGFQSAARKKLGYVQRIIMFMYKNPRATLKRVQAINDKFNKNKTIEIVETGRDHAVVRLHWFPHIPGIVDFCRFNRGIYTGIPTIWNLPPARVFETKCFFKGDQYCEYHLHWERKSWLRETLLPSLAPWSLLKSTVVELERDKELLKNKFNEIHQLNLELQEKIAQLLCLQQTSTAALSLLSLEELLRICLELLIHFTKLDRASIFLLDEGGETLELKHVAGVEPDIAARLRGYRIYASRTDNVIARTASTGSPTVLQGMAPGPGGEFLSLLPDLPSQAGILAPLLVHNQVTGVIVAERLRQQPAITEAEQQFVKSFANHMAIALEKAVLYQQLETSERKYRELVENSHEGIWIIDAGGFIRFANRRMREIAGDEDLERQRVASFLSRADLAAWERAQLQNREGRVVQIELELTSRNRATVPVSMSSVPMMAQGRFLGSFAMFSDLSEKKEMEKQLLQHEKMEALGTLAGGIAHNFNNLLMNILGLTGLILDRAGVADPAYPDLKQIEQEVIKGSALTKQLLSLGRGGSFSPRPIDLNAHVTQAAELFCRTRSEIVIARKLAPNLPAVEADPGQLEQVVLNLLVNAWQAMAGRGEMVLATAQVFLDEAFCQPYGRPSGRYVHLALTDSGAGMNPDTAAKIFEPFFTTKKDGKGTGLGLATVYAIINHHRGIIKVESFPRYGTTFHIYLPVSAMPVSAEPAPNLSVVKGFGELLLVDDEDSIRTVGQRILGQLGYQVQAAASGVQALEIYRQYRPGIDLVILDIVMPSMGGRETFERLKEVDPGVKVLVTSGYSLDGEAQKMLDAGALGFIQKPYRIDALSQKIAEILAKQ